MIAEKAIQKRDICLLLDNIRSVHNVGSIFRTAETIGVSRIYCLGITPSPLDRFGRKRKDFSKVALGAEDLVAWEALDDKNASDLICDLKKDGFEIIALEQDSHSVDYHELKIGNKALIILGNEVDGVSKPLLELSDVIAEIPLEGKKESLNVSVAVGIFLFRVLQ